SADGSQLALMATENQRKLAVKIYELASGRELRTISVPEDFTGCAQTTLAFTPDARVLAACADSDGGGASMKLKLWDLSARSKGRVLAEDTLNNFGLLSFSPGGRWLARGAALAQSVKVYDTATGTERQTFTVDKLPGQADVQSI